MSSRRKKIKKVALVVKLNSKRAAEYAEKISKVLIEKKITVLAQKEYSHLNFPNGVKTVTLEDLRRDSDMVISLGGDGTLIEAVKNVGETLIPILGVNLGGKGFLTELTTEELDKSLSKALSGDFRTEERIRLMVKHHKGWQKQSSPPAPELAVNELLITKGALAKMVLLKLFINDQPVATYRGDGLIISSPTGSTAYSMSAGGPILHPSQKTMLITPICPYTLTQRPFVVPSGFNVKLELVSQNRKVYALIDGRDGRLVHRGDIIEVEVAKKPFHLIRIAPRNFFQILRNKLSWAYEPPAEPNQE